MKNRFRFYILLIAGLLLFSPSYSRPRLLQTYPPQDSRTSIGTGPITFLFSEPMDLAAVAPYNPQATDSNRGYDIVLSYDGGKSFAFRGSGGTPIAREGGRLIEMSDRDAYGGIGSPHFLRVFQGSFRNLNGEPLDRDYMLPFVFCDGCVGSPTVRAAFPAPAQATPDPSQPFSLYFDLGVDPNSLQAELRDPDGSLITPLTYRWDMEANLARGKGYLHLTVEHPPLSPSPRPYVFRILTLRQPTYGDHLRYTSNLPESGLRITVGPALAGDLNDDGSVTLADALLTLTGVLSPGSLSPAQRFAADLLPRQPGGKVGDGTVTIADAVYLLRRAVGLIPDPDWP